MNDHSRGWDGVTPAYTGLSRREFFLMASKVSLIGLAGGLIAPLMRVTPAFAYSKKGPRLTTHRAFLGLNGTRALRIAHLSDLHAGHTTDPDLLRGAVELCRNGKPDLVVLTGDYLTASLEPLNNLMEILQPLPRPVVAVLGNHDHHLGASIVTRMFESRDIQVLSNAHTTLDLGTETGKLTVVGVDDAHTRHHDVGAAFHGMTMEERAKAVIITHRANVAQEIVAQGGRLILAGHTHGGQISIPILSRPLVRAMGLNYVAGWYGVGPARLFINVGLGTASFPLRVGASAQPEAALVDII